MVREILLPKWLLVFVVACPVTGEGLVVLEPASLTWGGGSRGHPSHATPHISPSSFPLSLSSSRLPFSSLLFPCLFPFLLSFFQCKLLSSEPLLISLLPTPEIWVAEGPWIIRIFEAHLRLSWTKSHFNTSKEDGKNPPAWVPWL